MKMKLYYGALALLWLLSSCTPSSNVTDNYDKVGTCRNGHIRALTLNGHTYYWQNHWFAHAGDCKKCKHELDSIVKAAVKDYYDKNGIFYEPELLAPKGCVDCHGDHH